MISQVVTIGPSPVSGMVSVSGYVTDFDECEVHGGPEVGGWCETTMREAFVKALAAKPRMFLTRNFGLEHVDERSGPEDRWPLARTSNGTLKVTVDDVGLKIVATVLDQHEDRLKGGILGYSFRVEKQEWDDSKTHRCITEISLDNCEIGITFTPQEENPPEKENR